MTSKLGCRKCPAATGSAFSCLTPAQLSRLAKVAVPHAYLRGQTIFYEGTPPLAAFCVQCGLVKLTRPFNHGGVAVVGVRSAGDLFGYRSVLAELPYGISAETVEPSVICTIPREALLALIEESRALAFNLLQRMAREFRFAEEQLVERSSERVATRTARFLVRLAEPSDPRGRAKESLRIPTRRGDMALLIGTTPETLSRTLHGFALRGLVTLNRTEIRVRNLAGLQMLADRDR
jgi:CRP/FNR family transcriptional regulator